MQHDIDKSKHGQRADAMVTAIESCVHCGFCLSACPTYSVLGEEMDSPRGRIHLMKNVLEDNLAVEEAQPYIDRCLGCMACVPACPSGVAYGDLLTGYRSLTESQRDRSLIDMTTRTLICETLPYPNRFRLAVQTGAVGKFFQNALPEKLAAMVGMIPDTVPKFESLPDVYPAKGERRGRVALLAGCVQQVLAPHINWATLRVLAENGIETIIPKKQGCCGSILMHIGEDKRAIQHARNNLNTFPDDIDAIITNAAGCGSGMHEYGLLFAREKDESRATDFADKVQDISVFLDKIGIRPPETMQKLLRVAYHDACHLLHAQGIHAAPRNLLNAIPNVTVVELFEAGMCCGSAGTYNLEQPEIASELGRRKAQAIVDAKVDRVVTGNIGCITQLETHLKQLGHNIPIVHTIQLLDWAYRE
ncbi:MAG: heterodisulfide reductase-related iron-sulfur binding cluster [Anaerolineae bacterium]|nr:heterodisulfide reductase-related iron-sulfur binding cluster [Anaerolineae bacterium]